jgi:hypothetical protein
MTFIPSTHSELGRGVLVVGGAGAGKTHYLSSVLEAVADDLRMQPHQVIPVLSAMHGARRRLQDRLSDIQRKCLSKGVRLVAQVTTIDAFVLALVRRLHLPDARGCRPDFTSGDFSPAHLAATSALTRAFIGETCASSFPLVVVDELQDCRGSQLAFLQAMAKWVPLVAAADPFQVLGDESDAPSVTWARELLRVVELGTRSRRTDQARIIASAMALRQGTPTNSGVECTFVASPDVAAKAVMVNVRSRLWRGGRTVMLSFQCAGSSFVQKTLFALNRERVPGASMQRLPFGQHVSEKQLREDILKRTGALAANLCVRTPGLAQGVAEIDLVSWMECVKAARRQGYTEVAKAALVAELHRAAHFRRAFGASPLGRTLMSIHSSKNQEWDNVILLWSRKQFRARVTDEMKRRLLYNAITRAKKQCLVIFDGPAHAWSDDPLANVLGFPTHRQVENSLPESRRRS